MDEPGDFAIWPENRESFELFMAAATQWRHAGLEGVPVGLDYAALKVVAAALRRPLNPERLRDIQAMEAAALKEWTRQRERRRAMQEA